MDEDGCLFINGRVKNLIILNGKCITGRTREQACTESTCCGK